MAPGPGRMGVPRQRRRGLLTAPLSVLLLASLAGCASEAKPEPELIESGFLLGGIQVNEPDMAHWHRSLVESGFNTVSLTSYASQGLWNTPRLEFTPARDSSDLVSELREAKVRGLRVALIPRVSLDHGTPGNEFLWHGQIMPESEQDLDLWFARYGEFVLGWARTAEEEGVDLLGLGSELSSLTATRQVAQLPELEEYYLNVEKQERERSKTLEASGRQFLGEQVVGWDETYDDLETYLTQRQERQRRWALEMTQGASLTHINKRRARLEEHWRQLIAEVRAVYSGQLTYAANFDQYLEVSFWDALDVIGVNAYFPLRSDLSAASGSQTLGDEFSSSWDRVLDDFEALRRERDLGSRPFVFTEMGYTRRRGGTLEPWAGSGFAVVQESAGGSRIVAWDQQPLDDTERALALAVLRERLSERTPGLLGGLLWWKLSTVRQHEEIESFLLLLDQPSEDPALIELRTFHQLGDLEPSREHDSAREQLPDGVSR